MRIRNLKAVTSAITKYGDRVREDVKKEIRNGTLSIMKDANEANPLPEQITILPDFSSSGLSGIVTASDRLGNPDLPIWWEVGTGQSYQAYSASLSPAERAIAETAYRNGKGTLRPHPYLFPAFHVNRAKFLANVRKILRKNAK